MQITVCDVELEFVEPVLATSTGNPEILTEFFTKKAPTTERGEEELAVLEKQVEANPEVAIQKASTIFNRDGDGLFLYDYQIVGHLKERVGALVEFGEESVKALSKWSHKRAVNQTIFVKPRRVHFLGPDGKPIPKSDGVLERPLRAETMQGERVALARSEALVAGVRLKFKVEVLNSTNGKSSWRGMNAELVRQCFQMGERFGMCQWRGGGYGRYKIVRFDVTEPPKPKKAEAAKE